LFDLKVEDPRLDCAILRPMKTEYDSFLAFYLTQDDEPAISFKETRFTVAPYEVPEDEEVISCRSTLLPSGIQCPFMQETIFHFVRDYETVKVEQEVPNEFLLVLYDGDDDASLHSDGKVKEKGAYYKNIERKMYLKKKRANVIISIQGGYRFLILTLHYRSMISTRISGRLSVHCTRQ
jgi:RNA polymerase II-associated factor 1